MASKIEWCDRVWEVTRGCTPVSAGCANCWAMRYGNRFSGRGLPYEGLVKNGKWTGEFRLLHEKLGDPLRWRKPQRIFVNSKSDLFHKQVPFSFIAAVFGVMASCSQHSFMVLTKRPERAKEWFEWVEKNSNKYGLSGSGLCAGYADSKIKFYHPIDTLWPLPNVWIVISAEDQETYDARLPYLAQIPAEIKGVSLEPMIGPVDLALFGTCPKNWTKGGYNMVYDHVHWVIVGCESGPKARPFKEEWARSIRNQCVEASVSFYYKQRPKQKGRGVVSKPRLDGRCYTQFPEVG